MLKEAAELHPVVGRIALLELKTVVVGRSDYVTPGPEEVVQFNGGRFLIKSQELAIVLSQLNVMEPKPLASTKNHSVWRHPQSCPSPNIINLKHWSRLQTTSELIIIKIYKRCLDSNHKKLYLAATAAHSSPKRTPRTDPWDQFEPRRTRSSAPAGPRWPR